MRPDQSRIRCGRWLLSLDAPVDQHQPARRGPVPDREQSLDLGIAKKVRRVLARREFQDHHALRPPVAFDRCWYDALDDVAAAVFRDEGGDTLDVALEGCEVVDGEIEDEIS